MKNDTEKNKPGYYAVIPANVRYSPITANAKLLYGEISALSNKEGCCFASNRYFSDIYGVTTKTVSFWIAELVDNGFITRELEYKEGTNEIVMRYLHICEEGINKNVNRGINKNVIDNTTSNINITSNDNLKEKNIIKKEKLEESFNTWYKNYPIKKAKDKAKTSFIKLIKENKTTIEELNTGLNNLLQAIENGLVDPNYVKHPSTWLNQGCWEDEYQTINKPNTSQNLPLDSQSTISSTPIPAEADSVIQWAWERVLYHNKKDGNLLSTDYIDSNPNKKQELFNNIYQMYLEWEAYLIYCKELNLTKIAHYTDFRDYLISYYVYLTLNGAEHMYPGCFGTGSKFYHNWVKDCQEKGIEGMPTLTYPKGFKSMIKRADLEFRINRYKTQKGWV